MALADELCNVTVWLAMNRYHYDNGMCFPEYQPLAQIRVFEYVNDVLYLFMYYVVRPLFT